VPWSFGKGIEIEKGEKDAKFKYPLQKKLEFPAQNRP
jgi:hypothetical protein